VRITSKELARICGVSIGTVDRALNNRGEINAQTRERILRISRDLGYRPHLVARSLKTGKTKTLGIVVFDLDNRFFAQLVNAVEQAAREARYFVYLTHSRHDLDQERDCLEHLAGLNVDGILLVPTNRGPEFARFLRSLHAPLVSIGNRLGPSVPFVGIQDREGMKKAVAFTAAKGYQRIVYVSPPLSYRGRENIYEVEERLEGVREAARHLGIPAIVLREKTFQDGLKDAVARSSARTAIMCSSDIYALQCLELVRAWGMQVPRDVGLMGFDDIDILKYVRPALTTISYPIHRMAVEAFALLKRLMEGTDGAAPALIETKIIERESL
jgi:LacI family transcriptional regulator, galactose operon repressor